MISDEQVQVPLVLGGQIHIQTAFTIPWKYGASNVTQPKWAFIIVVICLLVTATQL